MLVSSSNSESLVTSFVGSWKIQVTFDGFTLEVKQFNCTSRVVKFKVTDSNVPLTPIIVAIII